MGLKSVFESAAQVAFSVANEALKAAVYIEDDLKVYDPVTRTTSSAVSPVSHEFNVLVEKYKINETNNSVLIGDLKLLALQADFNAIPQRNAVITVNGIGYKIIDVGQDPYGVTWELQVRK